MDNGYEKLQDNDCVECDPVCSYLAESQRRLSTDYVATLVTRHGVDLLVTATRRVAINLDHRRPTTFEVLHHNGRCLERSVVDLADLHDVVGVGKTGGCASIGRKLTWLFDTSITLDVFTTKVNELTKLCNVWAGSTNLTTLVERFIKIDPSYAITVDRDGEVRGYLVKQSKFTNLVNYADTVVNDNGSLDHYIELTPGEFVVTAYTVVDGAAVLAFVNDQVSPDVVFTADATASRLLRAYVPMGDEVWVNGWPPGYVDYVLSLNC